MHEKKEKTTCNAELMPESNVNKLLKSLDINTHRCNAIPDAIDVEIQDFRNEVKTMPKDNKVKESKQKLALKEIKLANAKSNDIAQVLSAQHYDLHSQFSSVCKAKDREMMKVETQYYELKEYMKDKVN